MITVINADVTQLVSKDVFIIEEQLCNNNNNNITIKLRSPYNCQF